MLTVQRYSLMQNLECSNCGRSYDPEQINTFADCCNKPLTANYDLATGISKRDIDYRDNSIWRYHMLLPVIDKRNIISLGEGMTPILHLQTLGKKYTLPNLFLKDETLNPTGSFKARGLSVAVSKAKEMGISSCIIPTAGNAGGAMSAYCAKAGIKATVIMPRHTPLVFQQECTLYGAELILTEGLISDCGRLAKKLQQESGAFDMSTLKEPYRLEGKKTLGYEIAEQFNWQLPDVIIYPTGGGTGLVAIWKAFREMVAMGWIKNKLPRMIVVQAENCQPIVWSWIGMHANAAAYTGKASLANGLAVPNPFGEDMIMQTLKESSGTALAVTEEEMVVCVKELAAAEGILVAPEGAAVFKGLLKLLADGFIDRDEKILLLNTGSGYKYLENIF
ncbi:MAG: threonine synthase [Ferruginibacter sp.]